MAEPKKITTEQYGKGFINFYEPFKIVDPIAPVVEPLPDLGTSTGIKTTVEKPDININIKKLNDANYNPTIKDTEGNATPYFNVLSKKDFTSSAIKHANFKAMTANLDKVEKPKVTDMLSTGGIFGIAMGGDYGFGKLLEGPTGQSVFSAGMPSEMALNNHMENFAASEIAYTDMKLKVGAGNFKSTTDYMKTNDTGFAAVIGGMHFSRNPTSGAYEGHLGHLHGDEHTAHMMLKSIEALSKGLDPRGGDPQKIVNLKGYEIGENSDNSENMGVSPAISANGMAAITNDGYYTYVSGGPLGHTKTILRGGGNESIAMLNSLKSSGYNLTKNQMITAMATARTGNKTFTQAIAKYKTGGLTQKDIFGKTTANFTTNIAGVGNNVTSGVTSDVKGQGIASPMPTEPVAPSALQTASTLSGFGPTYMSEPGGNLKSIVQPVGSRPTGPVTDTVGGIDYSGSIKAQEDAANRARQQEMDNRDAEKADRQEKEQSFKDFQKANPGGYNEGGQVSNPVARLANILRASRLGYNQGGSVQSGYYGYQEGGEINMQEVGFVNGKTPDQVTDAQTVADTEPMIAEDGDFVINAAAVELVGVENLTGLVSNALNTASEEGVNIVDIPVDIDPSMMVDVLVSEGEFIVPRELIPYVEGGIETLEKINNAGKPEVANRVNETEMMQQGMQEELPEEEIMTEPQPQLQLQEPVMPALNTGGTVTLDFSNRGFV